MSKDKTPPTFQKGDRVYDLGSTHSGMTGVVKVPGLEVSEVQWDNGRTQCVTNDYLRHVGTSPPEIQPPDRRSAAEVDRVKVAVSLPPVVQAVKKATRKADEPPAKPATPKPARPPKKLSGAQQKRAERLAREAAGR